MSKLRKTVFIIIGSLLVAVSYITVNSKVVVGNSMAPTFLDGQRLFISSARPTYGDAAVIVEPDSGAQVVKRCVAIAGDSIQISKGKLIVNGQKQIVEIGGVDDLLPRYIGEGLPQSFDRSFEKVLIKNTPQSGFGIEAKIQLLNPDSQFALKIRRSSLLWTLAASATEQKWKLILSGGTLVKPRVIDQGALAPDLTKPMTLFLSLAGDRCSAFLNEESVSGPHPISEYAGFQHTNALGSQNVKYEGDNGVRLDGVRVGCEINYQVSGNFGINEVFNLKAEEYYFLGDNSSESRDSRHYGAINSSQIAGVAKRLWPRNLTANGWPIDN
ncbi:MAG: signal peptidase I [Planctomycetota bacterium]|nr:signal peptidase I [Planctomycetota bacterium]